MKKRRSETVPAVSLVFIIVAALFVYVLSYAPVVSLLSSPEIDPEQVDLNDLSVPAPGFIVSREFVVADGSRFPAYKPVDWIIDNTFFRHPLLAWAEWWGVRKEFEVGQAVRHTRSDP